MSAYLRLDLLSVFPGHLLFALYLLSGFLLFSLYLLPGPLLLTAFGFGPYYLWMPYPIIIIVSSTPSHLFKMYIFFVLTCVYSAYASVSGFSAAFASVSFLFFQNYIKHPLLQNSEEFQVLSIPTQAEMA